jgi:hypothetical protein
MNPHDLGALAKHAYYDSKQRGEDTSMPLAFMGLCTVAVGIGMLVSAYEKISKKKITSGRSRY